MNQLILKQGDIIELVLSPTRGHEQAGFRPAVIVSNDTFNALSDNRIICPITNTAKQYPEHIPLDSRTATTGYIMCDQIRTVTPDERKVAFIEVLPVDILDDTIDVIRGLIERISPTYLNAGGYSLTPQKQ
ncbi:MAG: type II toxin-antitoxin system PemK/MazF family toxin [Oscillospiraceae bacterium]|jgi:mRNA interferase MazF|nr:type II toxin-antitoxin system PemK/MazF family toxin [Oscillospiraceae bacterium]